MKGTDAVHFTDCYDNTICIRSDHLRFHLNRPSDVLELLERSDLFPDRLDRLLSCLVKGGENRWSSVWWWTACPSQVLRHLGNAQIDWSMYSRYNGVSWHYVFYFFGPGIYKTKPLTSQSDKRAVFRFELVAVCLYFLFTPQHCGRKIVRGWVRGLNSGQLSVRLRQEMLWVQDQQTLNIVKPTQDNDLLDQTYRIKHIL